MEIGIERTGPCKMKVSITIPPERIQEELEKTYKQTASTVTFPGFRKGKAPRKLVIKRFGDLMKDDAKERLVHLAIAEAIEKHNLEPVSDPDLDPAAIKLNEEEPIELVFELEVKPEFELGEYKGIEVELDPLTVTDAEIDEAINGIRSRFAYLKSLEDTPVDKKHYLTMDLVYHVDGKDDLSKENCQANMSLGIIDGIEVQSELEKLIGKKIDEQVELEIPELPPHFVPEDYREKAAKIQATIKDIREVTIPEVDEEFLKKIGMESVEELREKINGEALEGKKSKRSEEIEKKVMDVLIEKHPFDIPEKLLMQQITNQENNLRYEMLRLGVPAEKIAEETGKLDEQNREAAERTIRSNFIYDRIAEKEEITVSENEVENELRTIAGQQNRKVSEIRQQYEEKNLLPGLENFMRNQKIRKTLSDHARIVEKDAEGQVNIDEASSDAEESESSQSESP